MLDKKMQVNIEDPTPTPNHPIQIMLILLCHTVVTVLTPLSKWEVAQQENFFPFSSTVVASSSYVLRHGFYMTLLSLYRNVSSWHPRRLLTSVFVFPRNNVLTISSSSGTVCGFVSLFIAPSEDIFVSESVRVRISSVYLTHHNSSGAVFVCMCAIDNLA